MTELHMPTNLQTGEFQHNSISKVLTDSNKLYEVTYLDLLYNSLEDISNLTALVHLKTLNLEGNRIGELNASTFAGMHNLSMLYLGRNHIHKVNFKVFPQGLTNLWLLRNMITELDIAGASLPALNVLDLEDNGLATIDLPALFAACPALRVLPIALNPMQEGEAKRIVAELNRQNVSHYFGQMDGGCDSDEFEVSNICFPDYVFPGRSIWKAFVLLVLAVILVAVFVGSVRWIWYQMRY
uniref:Uncharacterized protein n=1 Tax=Anopheles atroparvus TaxID=41427 RepID=A0A182JHU6_ANOAO